MLTSSTCQAEPSALLLANYKRCLVWRCHLWFADEVEVSELEDEAGFLLKKAGRPEARLSFAAERCRWQLNCAEWHFDGSFDRLSKKVRQIFSGIAMSSQASRCALNEEEADAHTRTAMIE